MNKIVNFFVKSLSFDVFQIITLNCEISMRIKFYEFCKKLKVFDCKEEFVDYWKEIIKKRRNDFIDKNNEMLKYSKQTNITSKLSNDEILEIIYSIYSVSFYETFDYLLDFIKLNEEVALSLIMRFLTYLRTPNNKKQQQNQLEIIKKLIKYQSVKDHLKFLFLMLLNL